MLVALESDSFATVNGVESNKPGRPQSHVQKTAAMRMARADTPVEDPYKNGSAALAEITSIATYSPKVQEGATVSCVLSSRSLFDEKGHDHGDAVTIDVALQPRRKGSNESIAKKKGLR